MAVQFIEEAVTFWLLLFNNKTIVGAVVHSTRYYILVSELLYILLITSG